MNRQQEIRLEILRMCHENRMSHIGTSLSCVEILMAIYSIKKPDTRVIISKGHAIAAVLATLGITEINGDDALGASSTAEALKAPRKDEHTHKMPGVDWTTGSLGHGLSVGIGMAIAGRDVIVLCGDGEFDEGSCWEALGYLASRKVRGKLTLIIDYNGWGGYGRTTRSLKYRLCGFIEPIDIDGHDLKELKKELKKQPQVILAHTIKGKGVSFLEDNLKSHYTSLTDEEYEKAVKELSV
jgi:transketolase